jgi:hypothetical protein
MWTALWEVTNTGSRRVSDITVDLNAPMFYAENVYETHFDGPIAGFTCTVNRNYGTARCTGGSLGGSRPNIARLRFQIRPKPLPPGKTITVNLRATIDPDNTIRSEVSESNNAATRSVRITD